MIEMEVVLNVANQAGTEHGRRPGLLLVVEGWPMSCTESALRSVTEMNANEPRSRRTSALGSRLLPQVEGAERTTWLVTYSAARSQRPKSRP